ncbi:unannotated protein [freshwater metagenome]|uniref:Unannotated protein n=1 Tax=freshwater metagenome TaxID=449393 RepID=A0A6J6KB61_9ZZZZ
MLSLGSDDGGRVRRVNLPGGPERPLQNSVNRLGPTGGKNNLYGFCINNGSDTFSGVLEDRAGALPGLVDRRRIPHHIKRLTISLLDLFGHGAGGLVVEINAHQGS